VKLPSQKNYNWARCQWPTPVFLATWEAEIGKVVVWGQPGGIKLVRTHLNRQKLSVRVLACHCTCFRKPKILYSRLAYVELVKQAFYRHHVVWARWNRDLKITTRKLFIITTRKLLTITVVINIAQIGGKQ
jgi:hypothetical protein